MATIVAPETITGAMLAQAALVETLARAAIDRCWRLFAAILMGFGVFNVVEGSINHHLLGLHHVNETLPQSQWIYWDLGFLVWGAAMLIGGWQLFKPGKRNPGDTWSRS